MVRWATLLLNRIIFAHTSKDYQISYKGDFSVVRIVEKGGIWHFADSTFFLPEKAMAFGNKAYLSYCDKKILVLTSGDAQKLIMALEIISSYFQTRRIRNRINAPKEAFLQAKNVKLENILPRFDFAAKTTRQDNLFITYDSRFEEIANEWKKLFGARIFYRTKLNWQSGEFWLSFSALIWELQGEIKQFYLVQADNKEQMYEIKSAVKRWFLAH